MELLPNHDKKPEPVHPGPPGTDSSRPERAAEPGDGEDAPLSGRPGVYPSRAPREIGGKKFRVGTRDTYVPFRRRTKRRRRIIAACVAAALAMGAGAYGVVTLVGPKAHAPVAAGCPARPGSAHVPAALPNAARILVNVYNSTNRHGLAALTADLLKQRGFTIGKVTNDPLKANLAVPAQVRGAAKQASAMRVVAAEVTGAQLRQDSRADGSVDLVLGGAFATLATPAQVSAALAATPAVRTTANCG